MNRPVAHRGRCQSRALMARATIALFAAALLLAAPVESQSIDSASEQSIKAAYLYKFADYVEWPEGVLGEPAAPMTFGVVGDDSLADLLREMTRERAVHGRPINVRSIKADEPLDGVHVLFVGSSATNELIGLTTAAREESALVITEAGDGLARGSVINFREVDRRIRFEVSLDSADRSHLKLSARLLAVAERVEPRAR